MALESIEAEAMYKDKYRNLKRKLKFLIYENECFSMEIRNMEKKLLRILKDRSFLLDILSQHENASPSFESSDDDITDSSDGDAKIQHKTNDRKKKLKPEKGNKKSTSIPAKPRKKTTAKLEKKPTKSDTVTNFIAEDVSTSDHSAAKTGHMTPEEVERHLESRRAQQSQLEFSFAPNKAPETVPTEMFSNDIELDGGHLPEFLDDMDTSPSNVEDDNATLDLEHS